MDLTFHDADRTFIDIRRLIFLIIGLYKGLSAVYRKGLREAVPAYRYDTRFYYWNIAHFLIPPTAVFCLFYFNKLSPG